MPGPRYAFTPREPVERPSDPAVRRANLRRIGHLFRPYWRKLLVVTGLILLASGLGVIPAFLLRAVISTAFRPTHAGGRHRRLHACSASSSRGMIAISLVTGVFGVVQSYLSTQVGQSVMHDLRTSVYRHLQRLSLAFFTKTRTGEVQSRIANDIGGVDNVLTSTATSVMSTVTTVIATVVAMFLIEWKLALVALALMPLFVLITRKVGEARRKVATVRQESMADITSLVQESLSVSGHPARQDDGALRASSPSASRASPQRLAGLEVRSRMTGRWMMQSIQMTFAIMPAAIYWFGGLEVRTPRHVVVQDVGTLVAFTTLQTRLFAPIGSLLCISVDVQSSLALFDRIFEYLDLPVDIEEGTREVEHVRGDVRLRATSGSATARRHLGARRRRRSTIPAGTTTAIVGETGAGKTTLGYLVSRLYDVDARAASRSTASTCAS